MHLYYTKVVLIYSMYTVHTLTHKSLPYMAPGVTCPLSYYHYIFKQTNCASQVISAKSAHNCKFFSDRSQ